MPRKGSLADDTRVHVVRDAIITYRDALGADDVLRSQETEVGRALALLCYDADPVSRAVVPEVWSAIDRDHELALTLRVLRWEHHAIVLQLQATPQSAPRLLEAEPVAAVVEAYAAQRECTIELARAELHVAQWCAAAVDIEVSPELWRFRSGLTSDDVSIRIQRTGAGPPLIISADWRPLASGTGKKTEARGRAHRAHRAHRAKR